MSFPTTQNRKHNQIDVRFSQNKKKKQIRISMFHPDRIQQQKKTNRNHYPQLCLHTHTYTNKSLEAFL